MNPPVLAVEEDKNPEQAHNDHAEGRRVEDVVAKPAEDEFAKDDADGGAEDDNDIAHAVVPTHFSGEAKAIDHAGNDRRKDVFDLKGFGILLRDDDEEEFAKKASCNRKREDAKRSKRGNDSGPNGRGGQRDDHVEQHPHQIVFSFDVGRRLFDKFHNETIKALR